MACHMSATSEYSSVMSSFKVGSPNKGGNKNACTYQSIGSKHITHRTCTK